MIDADGIQESIQTVPPPPVAGSNVQPVAMLDTFTWSGPNGVITLYAGYVSDSVIKPEAVEMKRQGLVN